MANEPKGCSISQAAITLSVCKNTVRNLIKAGKLDAVKVNRRVVVLNESINKILNQKSKFKGEMTNENHD